MRRGVWVVLGLMAAAPGGALAQEAQRQPAEQAQGGSQGQKASQGAVQQQGVGGAAGGSGQAVNATGSSAQAGSGMGAVGQGGGLIEATGPSDNAISPEDNSGIVLEIPAGGVRFPGILGEQRSQSLQARSGMGGSGRIPSCYVGSNVPNEEVFVGTVRAATRDRLLMQDPSQRIYEFRLGNRTRILGPNGAALSLRALREGTPVRTVTRPGELENQVSTLQVLGRAKSPSR